MANYPAYIWMLVLTGLVGLPVLTAVGLYRAVAGSVSGRVALAVASVFTLAWSAWIVTSAVLADRGGYRQLSTVIRPWIGVAAVVPAVLLVFAAALPPVRASLGSRTGLAGLAWPQVLRVVGLTFLLAMAMHRLPAAFALPAGLGDIAIGLAAPGIAVRLARGNRSGAVWVTVLGLVDLVVAVSLGFLAALGPVRILDVTPSTEDLGLLPLVLIPTAAVPLAMALHLTSLIRLARRAPASGPAAVVSGTGLAPVSGSGRMGISGSGRPDVATARTRR
jgi:hypothetical protein